jgi:hypothetical protein
MGGEGGYGNRLVFQHIVEGPDMDNSIDKSEAMGRCTILKLYKSSMRCQPHGPLNNLKRARCDQS